MFNDIHTKTWPQHSFSYLNVQFVLTRISPPARCNSQSDVSRHFHYCHPRHNTPLSDTRHSYSLSSKTDWILRFWGEKSKNCIPWRQQNNKDNICIVVAIFVKVFKNAVTEGQLVSFLYSEWPFHHVLLTGLCTIQNGIENGI